jgi:hypothetical protein
MHPPRRGSTRGLNEWVQEQFLEGGAPVLNGARGAVHARRGASGGAVHQMVCIAHGSSFFQRVGL